MYIVFSSVRLILTPKSASAFTVIPRYEPLSSAPVISITLSFGSRGKANISPLINWLETSPLTEYLPAFSLPFTVTDSPIWLNSKPVDAQISAYTERERSISRFVPLRVISLSKSRDSGIKNLSVLPDSLQNSLSFFIPFSISIPPIRTVSPLISISAPRASRQERVALISSEKPTPFISLSGESAPQIKYLCAILFEGGALTRPKAVLLLIVTTI